MATPNTVNEPAAAEDSKQAKDLQKLADAYERDGTTEPGYTYTYVTRNGETRAVVAKLGK